MTFEKELLLPVNLGNVRSFSKKFKVHYSTVRSEKHLRQLPIFPEMDITGNSTKGQTIQSEKLQKKPKKKTQELHLRVTK